jgi:predicted RNA-binding Zn-ribbon protein involved in translation (DUF1610 family)
MTFHPDDQRCPTPAIDAKPVEVETREAWKCPHCGHIHRDENDLQWIETWRSTTLTPAEYVAACGGCAETSSVFDEVEICVICEMEIDPNEEHECEVYLDEYRSDCPE